MNILFLLADQINVRSLGAYGGRHVETPHLDRLAREGALCENAYCAYPVCSPSRASIVTGRYPHTHGILNNVDDGSVPSIINSSPITERVLWENGFQTYHFGRWHMGNRAALDCYRGRLERRRRSDYYRDKLPADIAELRKTQPVILMADRGNHAGRPGPKKRVDLYQETVAMTPAVREAHRRWQASEKAVYPILSVIGRSIIPPEHQPEAILADQVIETLRAIQGQPTMITWSVSPPHDPVVIPEPYYGLVPRTEALLPSNADDPPGPLGDTSRDFVKVIGGEAVLEYIAVYLGMVKYVDDQVGRMLRALDETGLGGDTLVLFTGDHGDMLGSHGMLAKSTRCFYEETTRVPLLFRCPGSIPAGRRVKPPVSLVDLTPTLLDYAARAVPEGVEGGSLRTLLEGETEEAPHPPMCENGPCRMIRRGDWKYAWYDDSTEWLFNLTEDPGEVRNLAGAEPHAGDLARLRAVLRDEMARTADPMRLRAGL